MKRCHHLIALLAALLVMLPLAAAATGTDTSATGITPPQPFTATYKVLRKGSPLGTSTLTLVHNADGTWTFRSSMKAQHGLAALLGGSVQETSRFRWHHDRIESLSYDYLLHTAVKSKQRHVKVDWKSGTVSVHIGNGDHYTYKTQPGLVERHVLVLAVGRAIAAGKTRIALPVAVKKRVETETFAVRGNASIKVPAGTFQAVRVDRTHDSKGYSVWFVPKHFGGVPVKLTQQSGGDITLLLESFKQ